MSKTYDKEKRKKIFDEIIDTEEKYLLSLETLNKNYIVPLKKNKYLKFGRELNSIVSNLTVIVNFNNHLLSKLKQTNEDDIGKTFQMIIPFLKTYTQYFSNYEAALNSIREADKNPKNKRFSEWLKKTDDRAKEQGQQTFKQLLIQPVQRIPRYNLLLSEVLKNTPKTHVDYENLRSASDKMKEVADHLNRQITEIENRNKLIKLKEIFVLNNTGKGVMTNIVEPHRKYVFEGELHVLSETSSINKQKHYFFLFSDIMVCCKEVPEELKKKLIEEKKAAQQSQASSKRLGGLKIFGRGSNASSADTEHNQFGAFDDDENEIPDHFYTITFTIKFTDKIGTGNTPVSSPMIASTPTSPSMEGSTNVEEIWVRDFSFLGGQHFQFPNVFQLITGTETYTFESTDAKSREKWVNHLNNTLDELKKKKKDTTKDRAKAKGFPVVMVNSAALIIQALARGKLTRSKKGDVENRFKPRKKTTKLNTNPLTGATSPTSPSAESIPTGPVTIIHTDVNVTAVPPEKSPRPVEEPIAKVVVEEPVTKPITPRVIEENPIQETTTVIDAATIPPQTKVEEPEETPKPIEEPKPVDEPIVEKPIEPVTEPAENTTPVETTQEPKAVDQPLEVAITTPEKSPRPVEEPKQPEVEEPKHVDPGITTYIEEPPVEEEPFNNTPRDSSAKYDVKRSPRDSISESGLRSPLSSPRLFRKDSNEEFKSPTKEEEEEVFFDEEGNVLPPWKVELMKKFKKSGKFNAILAQQNDNKKVEKKIDMPNKKLQLNAIRSMFEEKDKLAKEEMHSLRKAKESPQNTSSSSLK